MTSKQFWWFTAIFCISTFARTVYSQAEGNSIKDHIPNLQNTKYAKITDFPERTFKLKFIEKFDSKFFDNEKATNATSIDAFTEYIKAGAAEFQSFFIDEAVQFKDVKQKLLQLVPQYKVEKSFPLPDTSQTVTAGDQKLSATVTLHDVSLSGLNYSGTSKQPSFYILFTSDVITIAGQHSVNTSDGSIDGKFSYDVVNFANLIYLDSSKDGKNYLVNEISDFDSIKQGNIEFSPAAGTKEALFRELLLEAFNQSLLQTYVPIVFGRYRNIFDPRSIATSGYGITAQNFGYKIRSILTDLIKLYLEKFYNVIRITDVKGKTIEFENTAKLYSISHQLKDISDDGLIVQVKTTSQLEHNGGPTIHYDSAKYTLQYLYVDFTIKLKSAADKNTDIFANTEDVNVSVTTRTEADGGKTVDPEVATAINSAIKEGIVHFLGKIYSQSKIN